MQTDQIAICGGQPTMDSGPPSWPLSDPDVFAALEAAYRDGSWGRYHGHHTDQLREQLAQIHGVEHVKLCSSGTIAVELALRGMDLGDGDEVILGAYDFAGNFRCIEQVGARPVLADVERQTGCLTVDSLDAAYSPAVRAVIVSHLHSGLAPMEAILNWAAQCDVRVVEDACQAPGAQVDGRLAGTWGDIGVLSFGGSKLLTAGRGGALLIRDAHHWQRIKAYAERGNDAFPLSQLQAAAILPQVEKLADRNRLRQRNVLLLRESCRDINCLEFVGSNDERNAPSYYKIAWLYDSRHGGWTRSELVAAIQAEGVALDVGFRGFCRRSEKRCRHAGNLTNSRLASSSTVLLHHPVLLEDAETIERVAQAIRKVINGYVSKTED